VRAEDWDRKYEAAERLWSIEANRFVVEELSQLARGRALDLAAGEGRNALWLAERGFEVTARDFSRVALERGRAFAEQRGLSVRFEQIDVERTPPEPGAWDLVLIAYLQLPWPRMVAVLHGAARALAPGGTLLVVGHHLDNLEHGHGGPSDPAVLYTEARVAAELEGLVIERAARVERPVETAEGPRVALDVVVRARAPER
jgi:SAM-dependent methyltransferase